jgi:hypothetical protein
LADHFNFLPPSYLLFFFAATGRQFLDFFLLSLADRLDYLSEILSRRTSPLYLTPEEKKKSESPGPGRNKKKMK